MSRQLIYYWYYVFWIGLKVSVTISRSYCFLGTLIEGSYNIWKNCHQSPLLVFYNPHSSSDSSLGTCSALLGCIDCNRTKNSHPKYNVYTLAPFEPKLKQSVILQLYSKTTLPQVCESDAIVHCPIQHTDMSQPTLANCSTTYNRFDKIVIDVGVNLTELNLTATSQACQPKLINSSISEFKAFRWIADMTRQQIKPIR